MKGDLIHSTLKSLDEKYDLVQAKKLYRWGQTKFHKMAYTLAWRHEASRLRRFKNIHADRKRCFIIGNGPSIRQQDLTQLKGEITFVTNNFPIHPQYEKIAPAFLCVSDEDYSRVHSERYDLVMQKTKKTVKFLPLGLRTVITRENLFSGHQIYFMNLQVSKRIWEIESMSLDVTKGVHWGRTIIIDYCLPLAFYMGFSEVYLLGCDCDYKLDEAPEGSKAYFYDPRQANYKRSKREEGPKFAFEEVIDSYSIAKSIFERHSRKIYNAGFGGKLEVFERDNYDNLF